MTYLNLFLFILDKKRPVDTRQANVKTRDFVEQSSLLQAIQVSHPSLQFVILNDVVPTVVLWCFFFSVCWWVQFLGCGFLFYFLNYFQGHGCPFPSLHLLRPNSFNIPHHKGSQQPFFSPILLSFLSAPCTSSKTKSC